MKKTKHLMVALPLALLTSSLTSTVAAPRCYPGERFKVVDDQLVRDQLTKLVWQRQASSTALTWAAARTYCTNAGQRLPTVKELRSILDLTVYSGPTIDQEAFPNTPASAFWTSSPYAGSSSQVWVVDFGSNSAATDVWARCVR